MIIEAIKLAKRAHEGQSRRYTGEAYIMHPARVALQVSLLHYATEDMIAAAWLHDVVEDTSFDIDAIKERTSAKIAFLVSELTFDSSAHKDLDYAAKKHEQNKHIALASFEAKSIKILDRLDNLNDLANEYRQGLKTGAGFDGRYRQNVIDLSVLVTRYVRASWDMQDLLVKSNSRVGDKPKVDDYLLASFQVKLIKLNREFNLEVLPEKFA